MLAAMLPVLGLADVLLLRSGRGVSFGFESEGSKSAPRSVWLRPRAFHLT